MTAPYGCLLSQLVLSYIYILSFPEYEWNFFWNVFKRKVQPYVWMEILLESYYKYHFNPPQFHNPIQWLLCLTLYPFTISLWFSLSLPTALFVLVQQTTRRMFTLCTWAHYQKVNIHLLQNISAFLKKLLGKGNCSSYYLFLFEWN